MSNATKTAKRSDFKKYFQFMWRSLNIQASWNYERQMNMGFLYGIAPTLDELYPRNIDHFYVRNLPLEGAADCRVCATEPYEGVSISDHFALTVSVEARAHSSYRSSPNRLQG